MGELYLCLQMNQRTRIPHTQGLEDYLLKCSDSASPRDSFASDSGEDSDSSFNKDSSGTEVED